ALDRIFGGPYMALTDAAQTVLTVAAGLVDRQNGREVLDVKIGEVSCPLLVSVWFFDIVGF
ncbi:hypothetical protein, partial [Altericroceibacterium xinjiangense]|uniref:hypothetical protein n=1 Tax=Altericroceibacterium xinjiangense TaxID=762261 RepID=UPI0019D300B8